MPQMYVIFLYQPNKMYIFARLNSKMANLWSNCCTMFGNINYFHWEN